MTHVSQYDNGCFFYFNEELSGCHYYFEYQLYSKLIECIGLVTPLERNSSLSDLVYEVGKKIFLNISNQTSDIMVAKIFLDTISENGTPFKVCSYEIFKKHKLGSDLENEETFLIAPNTSIKIAIFINLKSPKIFKDCFNNLTFICNNIQIFSSKIKQRSQHRPLSKRAKKSGSIFPYESFPNLPTNFPEIQDDIDKICLNKPMILQERPIFEKSNNISSNLAEIHLSQFNDSKRYFYFNTKITGCLFYFEKKNFKSKDFIECRGLVNSVEKNFLSNSSENIFGIHRVIFLTIFNRTLNEFKITTSSEGEVPFTFCSLKVFAMHKLGSNLSSNKNIFNIKPKSSKKIAMFVNIKNKKKYSPNLITLKCNDEKIFSCFLQKVHDAYFKSFRQGMIDPLELFPEQPKILPTDYSEIQNHEVTLGTIKRLENDEIYLSQNDDNSQNFYFNPVNPGCHFYFEHKEKRNSEYKKCIGLVTPIEKGLSSIDTIYGLHKAIFLAIENHSLNDFEINVFVETGTELNSSFKICQCESYFIKSFNDSNTTFILKPNNRIMLAIYSDSSTNYIDSNVVFMCDNQQIFSSKIKKLSHHGLNKEQKADGMICPFDSFPEVADVNDSVLTLGDIEDMYDPSLYDLNNLMDQNEDFDENFQFLHQADIDLVESKNEGETSSSISKNSDQDYEFLQFLTHPERVNLSNVQTDLIENDSYNPVRTFTSQETPSIYPPTRETNYFKPY